MTQVLAVLAAFTLLGSDDYAEREAASHILARAVRNAPHRFGPMIEVLAVESSSAEVRARCTRTLRPFWHWQAVGYQRAAWPRLDAGDMAFEEMGPWLFKAREEVNGPCHFGFWWPAMFSQPSVQQRACEMFVRDRLASGHWSPAMADRFLANAYAAELRLWFIRQRLSSGGP